MAPWWRVRDWRGTGHWHWSTSSILQHHPWVAMEIQWRLLLASGANRWNIGPGYLYFEQSGFA